MGDETNRRALLRAGSFVIINTIIAVLEEPYKANPSLKLGSTSSTIEQRMRLPAATAIVLLNRFYARHSFARHDRFLVATACAFMGFKVEEMHQKVRHVINCAWDVFHRGLKPRLEPQGAAFADLRASVLETERCILYTLEFDVAVEHPFPHIKQRILDWRDGGVFRLLGFAGGKSLREVPSEISSAMTLANSLAFSSLVNGISLLYSPQMVAMACLFMSFQVSFSARGLTNPVTMQLLRKSIDGLSSNINSSSSSSSSSSTTTSSSSSSSSSSSDNLNGREDLLQIREICSRICYHLAEDALGDINVRTTYVDDQNKVTMEQRGGGGGGGGGEGRDEEVEIIGGTSNSTLNKEQDMSSSRGGVGGGGYLHRPHQSALAYALSVLEAAEETDASIDNDETDILGAIGVDPTSTTDTPMISTTSGEIQGSIEEEDDIIALPML